MSESKSQTSLIVRVFNRSVENGTEPLDTLTQMFQETAEEFGTAVAMMKSSYQAIADYKRLSVRIQAEQELLTDFCLDGVPVALEIAIVEYKYRHLETANA